MRAYRGDKYGVVPSGVCDGRAAVCVGVVMHDDEDFTNGHGEVCRKQK